MPIFKINGKSLTPIKEQPITLEKDIQTLTEENLEEVFGLEFVSSEFSLRNLRIDTLAFDTETNSFVIIEYKRDRNFSIIDQGYAYLSLLLNNKAEFILEYQEKKQSSISRDSIDWQQTRVIFIASAFTPHQQQAIQFKDLPIQMWKVRKYDNGTILYNQIEALESSASITTVSKSEQVQRVSTEVKKYTVEDHIRAEWSVTRSLFDSLVDKLTTLDSRIQVAVVKNYIGMYIGGKGICYIRPRTSSLNVEFCRTHPTDVKDPENKLTYIEHSMKNWHQHVSKMTIADEADIDYAAYIMKQRIESLYK